MLLIHHGPLDWDQLSESEQQRVGADYQALTTTPGVTPGEWMEEPELATTVRVDGGRTLTTDGPFVAVKEALGGYLFYEADDLDAASVAAHLEQHRAIELARWWGCRNLVQPG